MGSCKIGHSKSVRQLPAGLHETTEIVSSTVRVPFVFSIDYRHVIDSKCVVMVVLPETVKWSKTKTSNKTVRRLCTFYTSLRLLRSIFSGQWKKLSTLRGSSLMAMDGCPHQ